jgi:hypothetical protein
MATLKFLYAFAEKGYAEFDEGPLPSQEQGCQMVYFQTKNPNLGKFGRALEWKRLLNSLAI